MSSETYPKQDSRVVPQLGSTKSPFKRSTTSPDKGIQEVKEILDLNDYYYTYAYEEDLPAAYQQLPQDLKPSSR